jgi:ribonucleoside-diphosphate reductase alpha chain
MVLRVLNQNHSKIRNKKMSKMEYIVGGFTNLGARTRPVLSSCYLLKVHDDMEHITTFVSDVMLLSKGSGGIGASIIILQSNGLH